MCVLIQQNKVEDSIKVSDIALTNAKDNKDNKHFVYELRGDAFRRLERYGEALVAYDTASSYDKHYAYSYLGKIKVLHKLNRIDEMDKLFKLVLTGDCYYEKDPHHIII